MKKINLNELRKIQINILDYVDSFCRKNDINYWLDCGTLLGAVRHKGYIPWDDDIDIGMLREDYLKFIKAFNLDNSSNYKFHCYENDKNWHLPFGKVVDESTVLFEPDEKAGIKTSINIDVFVYDNAPSDLRKLHNMYLKRDIYTKLNNLQFFKHFTYESKNKYNWIRYPFHLLFQIFPKGYFVKKNIKNSKKYSKKETNYVGNFTSFKKIICEKSIFDSFIELDFEGNKYLVPIGYKKWLEAFYGDYMKLPPKSQQVSHHRFVAYYK